MLSAWVLQVDCMLLTGGRDEWRRMGRARRWWSSRFHPPRFQAWSVRVLHHPLFVRRVACTSNLSQSVRMHLLVRAAVFGDCERSRRRQRENEACFSLCPPFLVSAASGGEGVALWTSRVSRVFCMRVAGAVLCLLSVCLIYPGTALLSAAFVSCSACARTWEAFAKECMR